MTTECVTCGHGILWFRRQCIRCELETEKYRKTMKRIGQTKMWAERKAAGEAPCA